MSRYNWHQDTTDLQTRSRDSNTTLTGVDVRGDVCHGFLGGFAKPWGIWGEAVDFHYDGHRQDYGPSEALDDRRNIAGEPLDQMGWGRAQIQAVDEAIMTEART